VLHGATPQAFARHVTHAVSRLQNRRPEERLLFVKSWNEWAEGNYLEPDATHGLGWLEALERGLHGRSADLGSRAVSVAGASDDARGTTERSGQTAGHEPAT
jgi:hypothetical protein